MAEGLVIENPINERLQQEITAWEEKLLPKKGYPRLLQRVYLWLSQYDEHLAKEFRDQTKHFKRLP